MKDATVYILSEIRRMLHGVISVPVFLQEVDADNTAKKYVIVQPPYSEQDGNKTNFTGKYYLNLDVTEIVPDNGVSVDGVEGVAGEILGIICPTVASHGFVNSTSFSVTGCRLVRGRPLPELRTDTELLIRKILEFEVLIYQK